MFHNLLASVVAKYAELKTRDEAGQGLVEYAILLMTVSVVMVTIMTSIGGTVSSLYVRIGGAFPAL
jgi:Flp pilus assembly pilin Flp